MAGLLLTQTLGHGGSFARRCPLRALQCTALNKVFYFSPQPKVHMETM